VAFILKSLSKGNIFLFIQAMDGLDRNLAHSYEITSESRIHDELRGFFDSIYLNDHVSLREKVKQTVLDQVEETPSSSTIVIDRTFGSVKLFGRTFTVRFGPNDRTFFCRTQNLFFHVKN
jgi:hypothetical protein